MSLDRVGVGLFPFAHQISFAVRRPRSVWLANANLLKAFVHKINKWHAEGREKVEDFDDEVAFGTHDSERDKALRKVQLLRKNFLHGKEVEVKLKKSLNF